MGADKIENRKVIVPGIYSGNYGHFFCSYLPWLAKYRQNYPDAIIIGAGDHIFKPYAERYCDYYYGYDHPWNTDSPPSAPFKEIMKFKDEVEKSFKIDEYVDLLVPGEHAHNIFMGAVDTDVAICRHAHRAYDPQSKIVVLWPRYKNAAMWRNNKEQHWKETATLLVAHGYEVVGVGVPESFIDCPGVTDVTSCSKLARGYATRGWLEQARCVLMDQSGVFNETLFVGCPTLIFNSDPHHLPKIRKRNIFNTKLDFFNPFEWPNWTDNPLGNDYTYMDPWINKVFAFIQECRTCVPYEKSVANHHGVFQKR